MSKRHLRTSAAIWLTVGVLTLSPTFVGCATAQDSTVSPEAVELLRSTTDYLGSLEQFSAGARNLREDQLDSGQRVDLESVGRVMVRRPDKLLGWRQDGPVEEVLMYDGTSVTLYNDADQTYMMAAAPATIEEMILFVYQVAEMYPVSDLLWRDAFPYMMKGVDFASVVGTEVIDGVECTHLLFNRPDVAFQIWIPVDGPPLPTKYVVTDNATPEKLSIITYLGDWDVDHEMSDEEFTFVPPDGATEVPFPTPDSNDSPSR